MSGMPQTSLDGYAMIMKVKGPSIEKRALAWIKTRGEWGGTREEVQLGLDIRSEVMSGRLRKLELEHKIIKAFRTRMQSTYCFAVVFVAPEFATPAEVAANALVHKRTEPPLEWNGLLPADAPLLAMILDEYMRLAGIYPDDDRYPEVCRMRDSLSNSVPTENDE